jgi:hypothetical protein
MFITGLEPLLGIMSACLPFFPNVAKRVCKSPTVSTNDSSRISTINYMASHTNRKLFSLPFDPFPDTELATLLTYVSSNEFDVSGYEGGRNDSSYKYYRNHSARADIWSDSAYQPFHQRPDTIYVRKDFPGRGISAMSW